MQALAHIKGIELNIWRLEGDNQLVPHRKEGHYDYANYTPPTRHGNRVNLLFTDRNHFEQLEFSDFDAYANHNVYLKSEIVVITSSILGLINNS